MSEQDRQECCIMTPVFEGSRYRHHVCSSCNGKIEFEQSCFGGSHFSGISLGESSYMRFCPLCGREIIRFKDEPIYIKPLDLEPLEIFGLLVNEYERKAQWLYHCYLNETHKAAIDALIPLAQTEKISPWNKAALECAKQGQGCFRISYQTKQKLRREFGEDQEKEKGKRKTQ